MSDKGVDVQRRGSISDGAAAAAKVRARSTRGMHAPQVVADGCSRTVRRPPPRVGRGVGRCGCTNVGGQAVGTAVGAAVGAAVGQNLALQPSG